MIDPVNKSKINSWSNQ